MIPALLYTLLFAFCSGFVEALWIHQRITAGNREKLPHLLLSALRACIIGAIAGYFSRGSSFWHFVIAIPALGLVFAPVHRFTLNLFGHNRFYYMGPTVRSEGDSWYDTMWMWFACDDRSMRITQSGSWITTYVLARPWLPFLLCTAFETLCATGLFALNAQLN